MSEEFYKTFDFKGRELFPFGEGRRAAAMAIGVKMSSEAKPTIIDLHAIIYICLSTPKEIAPCFRDPDSFWQKILEWADTEISPADYEAEMDLVKRLMENAISTKAEAVESADMLPDPTGN